MDKININIPGYINDIIICLQNAGAEAYIVGGCVRDALLGVCANDWDVCTSAVPETVKTVLSGYKIVETGIAHGTVTAVKNGNICEITTFRSDGNYTDHRRPDHVSFTSDINSDLARRDFTVNAMAYAPSTGLIDLFGGQSDLKSKTIRCVGTPKTRFDEDALRIIRALRFSACLKFEIEEETKKAIFSCYKLLDFVASERIYHEFIRLICGDYAWSVVSQFSCIFERILGIKSLASSSYLLKTAPKSQIIRLALLFCNADSQTVYHSLKNLRADNKTINGVLFLLDKKDTPLKAERFLIRKLLSDVGRDYCNILSEFLYIINGYSLLQTNKIREMIKTTPVITLSTLSITGSDLIEMGVPTGKEIKKLLASALDAVIYEQCPNEKNALISYISNLQF